MSELSCHTQEQIAEATGVPRQTVTDKLTVLPKEFPGTKSAKLSEYGDGGSGMQECRIFETMDKSDKLAARASGELSEMKALSKLKELSDMARLPKATEVYLLEGLPKGIEVCNLAATPKSVPSRGAQGPSKRVPGHLRRIPRGRQIGASWAILTPTEAYQTAQALRPLAEVDAKARQREHGGTAPGKHSAKVSQSDGPQRTVDAVGRAVGVSGRTLEKIEDVAGSAFAEPERVEAPRARARGETLEASLQIEACKGGTTRAGARRDGERA